VFEIRVLRRIFRPKSEEVTGGWMKLHNEEFHDLISLPGAIRMIKNDVVGRTCSMNGGRRETHIGYWWESQKERDC
jgi:hypothetical protein